ncbi:MAG: hypothetical protein JXB39_12870 [Deltaproteobacteria bacterium]|nr:hypothetical protein [Deltaproteobacteria bacterium]
MSPFLVPLLAVLAAGDTPPAPPPEPAPPSETADGSTPGEVIYVDEQAVRRAREEVGLVLRDLGYRKKRTREGRDYYANEAPWKPWVVVDDDGWMILKRAPVTFSKPELEGIWRGPLGYLVCVVQPTACIHLGGLVVSERKLQWQKQAVLEAVKPALDRYEAAILERNRGLRFGEDLPVALEDLWNHGIPLEGTQLLETWEARRRALLEFWLDRNDNDWGAEARSVTEAFMANVVQDGPHPFTAEEIASTNARRTCEQALVLPDP